MPRKTAQAIEICPRRQLGGKQRKKEKRKKKERKKNERKKGTKCLVVSPGLGVDPLPSRYSSPSEESEESPVNGIERIWLARCEQNHYFSLISFLISARTTKNGDDNDGKSAF